MERTPFKIFAYLAFFLPVCVLGSSDVLFQSDFEGTETSNNHTPAISLSFTGSYQDVDGVPGASAGDHIEYTYEVTNSGETDLQSIVLSSSNGIHIESSNLGSLAPEAVKTTTGTHTLTQDDINSGGYTATASVTAQCSENCGAIGSVSDNGTDTRSFTRTPGIQLVIFGVFNDSDATPGPSNGDTIDYTFLVTNIGNISLTGVTLAQQVSGVTIDNPSLGNIQPGASKSTTGSVTLDQGHIDAGQFDNTASVSASCSAGCPIDDSHTDTRSLARNPSVSMQHAGVLNGDNIAYTFTVSNTGNVTLHNVTIAGLTQGVSIDDPTLDSIAPGSFQNRSGEYTLTANDINAGIFTSSATVTAQCTDGCPVQDTDTDSQYPEPPVGEEVCHTYFIDGDGDTFGEYDSGEEFCSTAPGGPTMPGNMTDNDLDCDDNNPYAFPGNTETKPDANYADENCDGIDGNISNAIFVSEATGADTVFPKCGTQSLPCQTIDFAISRMSATGKTQLYVAEGTYDYALLLASDVQIYGGYDLNNWHRSPSNDSIIVGELNHSTKRGYAVELAANITVELNNLVLIGTDTHPSSSDMNSYVVYANSGSHLVVDDTELLQGNGRNGANGEEGNSASQSPAPPGSPGNGGQIGSAWCNHNARAVGGAGGINTNADTFTAGGSGGPSGKMDSGVIVGQFEDTCIEEALPGDLGGNAGTSSAGLFGYGGQSGSGMVACGIPTAGANGSVTDGAPGEAGTEGDFNITGLWFSGQGGNGVLGQNGTGGGGGGGAGGCDIAPQAHGGGGGGGGAGGYRASAGGEGGFGGGGSFGIFINNGTLEVKNTLFLRGNGGNGGNGGDGAFGQPGGLGGAGGGGASSAKAGAPGGMGGRGGHSGGGGGGAGGPSCGILALDSNVSHSQNYNQYQGGQGGQGGDGGGGPISGIDGQNGALCHIVER